MLLNKRGLLHRGVFIRGSVKCIIHEGSTIITGKGVVKAASLESNLKVAGMFYDDNIKSFITDTGRAPQIELQSFYVHFSELREFDLASIAPNLSGTFYSLYDGWQQYQNCIGSSDHGYDKVKNGSKLIEEIKDSFPSLME